MFWEMRRREKRMSQEETIKLLEEGSYGTLASIGENGYPTSTPLNYVYKNGAIYFHSAHNGLKVDNIRFNQNVSFSVVGYYRILPDKFDVEYDSAIVYGKASHILDENEKKEALLLLIEKYSNEFIEQGKEYILRALNNVSVYQIEIEHMTGKRGR